MEIFVGGEYVYKGAIIRVVSLCRVSKVVTEIEVIRTHWQLLDHDFAYTTIAFSELEFYRRLCLDELVTKLKPSDLWKKNKNGYIIMPDGGVYGLLKPYTHNISALILNFEDNPILHSGRECNGGLLPFQGCDPNGWNLGDFQGILIAYGLVFPMYVTHKTPISEKALDSFRGVMQSSVSSLNSVNQSSEFG